MTDKNRLLQDGHPAIFSLRIAAIVSAFTTLVVFAWAIKAHDHVYTDLNGASLCVMILATASYAVLWSLVPLTAWLLLRRSLHPGVYIAFDFIAFAAVFATTLVTMIVLTPIAEGGYSCRRSVCIDTTLPKVEFFGFAMALLTSVLHFILFVWACWACDRHRKQPRKTNT
ncbi:hypothetical protein BDV27DRAFT_163123 [Aspergillus caelatus]|uniref:MARVEL domain-containing protein n=1 Tax=Aspergillus caelatus TaxID=61420 RepID=A0A5N6ZNA9_9EURO|nr:uncharacterized protein BDV27DRAFT_163123 [Aspergillus caelatus]KAE8358935.1 hypothetical protein BDV27DRAFT_163123 [Aspergillus caelatus]